MNSALDGQVVEHVGDPHLEEVVDGDEVKHPTVQTRLQEPIFVLRKTDVVEPADNPLVVQQSRFVKLERRVEKNVSMPFLLI